MYSTNNYNLYLKKMSHFFLKNQNGNNAVSTIQGERSDGRGLFNHEKVRLYASLGF